MAGKESDHSFSKLNFEGGTVTFHHFPHRRASPTLASCYKECVFTSKEKIKQVGRAREDLSTFLSVATRNF
jgi:hypothetical protein